MFGLWTDGTFSEEGRQFDKIVSIGMIEHVGKENLGEFFNNVNKMLKRAA